MQVLRDVLVPSAVLRDASGFGGVPVGACRRGDLEVDRGQARRLLPAAPTAAPRLVMPWLVEVHCHLDKCHTAHRIGDIGGDLALAIARQKADKARWSVHDIHRRAAQGLGELRLAGCRTVRSHVDWGDSTDPPPAWNVLGDLAEQAGAISLERAALVGVAQLASDGAAIAAHVAAGRGALGTYLFDQPERRDGIRAAFALAERFGLALDFHVDEGLVPGLDGLEAVADAAIETGFQGPVLCGHGCSLMNAEGDRLARLLDKLAASGIVVAGLPVTNLYLQGRTAGTPDRRGVTRLRELRAAGVPIVIGSDNVGDAFCPTGAHDPMAALNLAVLAAHLDPPLEQWLGAITTDAARALGRDPVFVDGAPIDDLAVYDGWPGDLIAGRGAGLRPLPEALAT